MGEQIIQLWSSLTVEYHQWQQGGFKGVCWVKGNQSQKFPLIPEVTKLFLK